MRGLDPLIQADWTGVLAGVYCPECPWSCHDADTISAALTAFAAHARSEHAHPEVIRR
jgi:hypothetical protein